MNPPSFLSKFTSSLDLSPYLTKGIDAGKGVTLMVGDMYTYLLLGSGPLLILAALVLVKVMYARVKFFALEYGNGGFLGRMKIIVPFVTLGGVLLLLGGGAAWLGWQAMGYSVTLTDQGAYEIFRGKSQRYAWADAKYASERIKSDDFMISFTKDGSKCRVQYQQRYIGEKLQDKAIGIAEAALAYAKVERVKKDGGTTSAP